MKEKIKIGLTIIAIIVGVCLGIYVGLWLMFVGGILGIVGFVQGMIDGNLDGMLLAISILKIMFSGAVGWLCVVLVTGLSFKVLE